MVAVGLTHQAVVYIMADFGLILSTNQLLKWRCLKLTYDKDGQKAFERLYVA